MYVSAIKILLLDLQLDEADVDDFLIFNAVHVLDDFGLHQLSGSDHALLLVNVKSHKKVSIV